MPSQYPIPCILFTKAWLYEQHYIDLLRCCKLDLGFTPSHVQQIIYY